MHGVVVLMPIVASPLLVCYRAYHRRWSGMAAAVVVRGHAEAAATV